LRHLDPPFERLILDVTGSSSLHVAEQIQSLWSGYGQILRIGLEGGDRDSVVVKHVRPPSASNHPRGWNSDASHLRKVKSYGVETAWYRDWSSRCSALCRVPEFLASEDRDGEVLMVMEDLDAAGFPARLGSLDWPQIEICLRWLANFHAIFLGEDPQGLWQIGTYWHLDTRADELAALDDEALKTAARTIDHKLNAARYQTLVHGDAKLANFCFSEDGKKVAAVDFQYIGGGCGMKDVAYFAGSCLDEKSCEALEPELLKCYFAHLQTALDLHQPAVDAGAVIDEWRDLYHLAWTDFHRFLKGWSPGHWKINDYSERVAKEVVHAIRAGT
jgi:hypothetical protein